MASDQPPLHRPADVDAAAVSKALCLVDFFPEFNPELCVKVFPRSGVAAYAPGAKLTEQGETLRDLFILVAGDVSVRVRRDAADAEVARLGAGAVLGEIALLRAAPRTATAVASTAVRAFRLSYADVGYILEHNKELAAHLRELARRRAS